MIHDLAQDGLAVPVLSKNFLTLLPVSFSLILTTAARLFLQANRTSHRELRQVVVREGHARFQAVRHAQLVFDDQRAMQEGFRLEIQRMIDVILGPIQLVSMVPEHIAKNIARPYMFDFAGNRANTLQFCLAATAAKS